MITAAEEAEEAGESRAEGATGAGARWLGDGEVLDGRRNARVAASPSIMGLLLATREDTPAEAATPP